MKIPGHSASTESPGTSQKDATVTTAGAEGASNEQTGAIADTATSSESAHLMVLFIT